MTRTLVAPRLRNVFRTRSGLWSTLTSPFLLVHPASPLLLVPSWWSPWFHLQVPFFVPPTDLLLLPFIWLPVLVSPRDPPYTPPPPYWTSHAHCTTSARRPLYPVRRYSSFLVPTSLSTFPGPNSWPLSLFPY